ncbi:hypothetical protein A176_007044 [Myxococcus hansupus]|uniref:Uncharacterized protein n=1 Tax=Pseudomyxococcus hansupus TaxID=1297742 RepID=A0A0H4XP37_9BACT|nr:hypothetical protein A176_007044 [Myxococcus hansupus]
MLGLDDIRIAHLPSLHLGIDVERGSECVLARRSKRSFVNGNDCDVLEVG